MEHGSYERLTLDFDPDAFPCKQLYLHNSGELWWDLDLLHIDLLQHGVVGQKFKFVSQFRRLSDATALLAGLVYLHTASPTTPVSCLCANICTSLALLFFFWHSIDNSRCESLAKRYQHYLVHVARRCCDALEAAEDVAVSDFCLNVRRSGQVSGFAELLRSTHSTLAKSWPIAWAAMRVLGLLEDDFDAEFHNLRDIVIFVAMFRKIRRRNNKPAPSPLASKLLDDIRDALLKWLVLQMTKYVMDKIVTNRDDMQKPPPAVKRPKPDGQRTYVRLSPDAIWALLEKARSTGSSLQHAIALSKDAPSAGCCVSQCAPWIRKLQHLYTERVCLGFKGVHHYNIVADQATHSCCETLVTLAYSWENNLAAVLATQIIPPGKHLTRMDHDMPHEVAVLAAKRKLERVAAFRQMQAISHQLHHLTQGSITLDHFVLPDNVNLRPVAPHEVRFVRKGDVQDAACVQGDDNDGGIKQVLPDDFVDAPLLVLSLDQGSIGAAGVAYAINELDMMLSCRFDKFHRLVRDMKLALAHCVDGVFLKTQLFSAYIYGLNYKPFGTGGFSSLKQRLLQVFLATTDIYSDIWCKYKHQIGVDLNMPSSSDDESQALFEAVASLPSFHHKLSFPKLGRWLSWNNSAHEYMPEFTATKMLFEHHLGNQPDPDDMSTFNTDRDSIIAAGRAVNPRAELAALKNASGGLALAYKLMSSDLQVHVKILYTAAQACWDWYTDQVKHIKTASDGFQYSVQMAQGRWAWSPHLWLTISHCLYNATSLEFMSIPNFTDDPNVQQLAHKTLMLVWHLICNRAWSLTRHDCPPECYASVASASHVEAQATMDSMQADWKKVVMLEQRVHNLPAARLLWSDIDSVKSRPIRLLFVFFERDQWHVESLAGRKLLAGLLWQLPDNKIVEDCHAHIRRESKANANQKLSISRIQDLVLRSGVFESRGINHPAAVTQEVFVRNIKKKTNGFSTTQHRSARHKMSERWTSIMGKRNWNALTEESMHKSAAAWRWLQTFVPGGHVKLDSALFSRLVLPFTLIQNDAGAVYASMGNAVWGALGWPVSPVAVGPDSDETDPDAAGMSAYAFDAQGSMTWIHVTNPLEWHVLPMAGARAAGGIILKQIAAPYSLMHFFLANRKNPLPSYDELLMCVKCLNLEFDSRQPPRKELLKALAVHFGDATIADAESEKPAVAVAEDPLTEFVFEDMDKQEQMEFPEVHRSISQKHVRRRVAEWAELTQPFQKKVIKQAVPKKKRRPPAGGGRGARGCGARGRGARGRGARGRGVVICQVPAAAVLGPEVEPEPAEPEALLPVPLPPAEAPGPAQPPEPVAPLLAVLPLPAAVVPPAVDVVVDRNAPVGAVVPPGQPVQKRARAGPVGPLIPWEPICCDVCHVPAGQIKLEPAPGQRDGPSWVMRVRDPATDVWPTQGARFRTRRTSVVGEDDSFAKAWVQKNRTCCPQPV